MKHLLIELTADSESEEQLKEEVKRLLSSYTTSIKSDREAYARELKVRAVEETFKPNTVVEAMKEFYFSLPTNARLEDWRVVQAKPWGEVSGLHTLRGFLVVTNGILAVLVREDYHWSFVHLDHFVPDKSGEMDEVDEVRRKVKVKVKETEAIWDSF